jgi:hypothetical protein
MTRTDERLGELADKLARGGDPERADIVRRAQRFKRSWIELAEGLSALRKSRAYERWGYRDLYEYCQQELHLKAATIDKLVLSYGTLQAHAPEVLERDGVEREIPSVDSVDYFNRAFGLKDTDDAPARRRLDAPKDVLAELRSAVFDEAQSVGELRKRFDPVLRPKDEREQVSDAARKAKQLGNKLIEAVQAVEGLSEKRVARVIAMVEALNRDLDAMVAPEDKSN